MVLIQAYMAESNELNLIHDICGPIITERISQLIINMKYDYDHNYDLCKEEDLERVDACLNFLHKADYCKFYSIYVNIPTNYECYEDDEFEYCYLEYTLAILSDISLINRCLAISKAPLNRAINALYHIGAPLRAEIPKSFNIECYELLYHNKFNIANLFPIAQCKCDYISIKFIIDKFTESDIDHIFIQGINYFNSNYSIIEILLIDRCKQIDDKYILSRLYNNIINSPHNVSLAYYIINIMSYEDGLNYVSKLQTPASDLHDINKLLAYHFRPRGSHTKGAITAF
jgi:hypothetical protein